MTKTKACGQECDLYRQHQLVTVVVKPLGRRIKKRQERTEKAIEGLEKSMDIVARGMAELLAQKKGEAAPTTRPSEEESA